MKAMTRYASDPLTLLAGTILALGAVVRPAIPRGGPERYAFFGALMGPGAIL